MLPAVSGRRARAYIYASRAKRVKCVKAVTLRSAKKGKAKKQEPCGDSSASDTKEFGSQLMVSWSYIQMRYQ